jgi:hypothetical protein
MGAVKLLVAKGADVNLEDVDGTTVSLHLSQNPT